MENTIFYYNDESIDFDKAKKSINKPFTPDVVDDNTFTDALTSVTLTYFTSTVEKLSTFAKKCGMTLEDLLKTLIERGMELFGVRLQVAKDKLLNKKSTNTQNDFRN